MFFIVLNLQKGQWVYSLTLQFYKNFRPDFIVRAFLESLLLHLCWQNWLELCNNRVHQANGSKFYLAAKILYVDPKLKMTCQDLFILHLPQIYQTFSGGPLVYSTTFFPPSPKPDLKSRLFILQGPQWLWNPYWQQGPVSQLWAQESPCVYKLPILPTVLLWATLTCHTVTSFTFKVGATFSFSLTYCEKLLLQPRGSSKSFILAWRLVLSWKHWKFQHCIKPATLAH